MNVTVVHRYEPVHIVHTSIYTNRHHTNDMHASRITSNHYLSSSDIFVTPRYAAYSSSKRAQWWKLYVQSSQGCVSVSDALLHGSVVISLLSQTSSPILQARTLSISSHYSVTWNRGAKKPNQLLRLLNESNFLPESTRHAHTSIASLNYLLLIQINKSHHHQGYATPQWQTMTTHLYHCTKTTTYSMHQNTVNNLI